MQDAFLPESAALKEPVGVWLDFFRAKKDVFTEALPILGAHAATLYVGTCQAAEATTMSNALANWVGKIPETAQNQEMLSSWQEAPKNRKEAVRFLAQSLAKHHQSQKEWGAARGPLGGDSDDDNFLERVPKRKRHEKANESEDSDDRNAKSLRGPSKEKEERLSVSESESEPAAEPYASWNQAEAEHFVAEVDAALKSLDGPKPLKITHEGLVTLFGTVPEAALQHHMLDKRLVALKKLTKLPKAETLTALLHSLKELGEAAVAKTAKGREVLKVHRVNGLTADGRAAVQDSERVDEVELEAVETIRTPFCECQPGGRPGELEHQDFGRRWVDQNGGHQDDFGFWAPRGGPCSQRRVDSPLWSKVHACRLEEALVESHQVSGCLSIDRASACVVLR